ncbi:MAG: protoporphyrinogen oxidase [Frankiales bacterium]|nr:protoporphyrinogen oxidase [Frankiales bacterium]
MARIAVVGAGIAGLAAAHALREHEVVVVEGAGRIGGKLSTSDVGGVDVDEGAESFLARVPEGLGLARAVGLGDEIVHPATTSARVWARGRLRPLPPRSVFGVPANARSLAGVLSAPEVLRAAYDLAAPMPDDDGAGDESVGALVGRRLGRAVVVRLVDPLLGGVYAGRADELSVRATAPQLAGAAGSLMRAVARSVPVTQSPAPVFASLRPGMGALADAVARRSGAEVVLGRPARSIERLAQGFRVVHGPTTDERWVAADAVVVAVPPAPAGRLLADLAPAAATELATIEMASMAIVTTVWPSDGLPSATGSGYLVPPDAGRPVKAVTFTSQKWSHVGAPGSIVVRCSLGRHGDTAVLQRDDTDLVELAVAELSLTCGARGRPSATRVTRWGGALPQYAVGHLDRVARIKAAVAAVPGLAVCGAAYEGVGIPACIRSGQAAADQLLPMLRADRR